MRRRENESRRRAGQPQIPVQDLKHTFGQRLRAEGVSFEDRSGRLTTRYSMAELQNLIETANRLCEEESCKKSRTDGSETESACRDRRKRFIFNKNLASQAGVEPTTPWFVVGEVDVTNWFY